MKMPVLYSDDQGTTHWKDVEWELKPGSGPYPYDTSDEEPSIYTAFRVMQPGTLTDWHTTKAPHFGILLSGEMEIEVGSGEKRRFRKGDILMSSDTSGQGHVSSWTGNEPCLVVFIAIPESVGPSKI